MTETHELARPITVQFAPDAVLNFDADTGPVTFVRKDLADWLFAAAEHKRQVQLEHNRLLYARITRQRKHAKQMNRGISRVNAHNTALREQIEILEFLLAEARWWAAYWRILDHEDALFPWEVADG